MLRLSGADTNSAARQEPGGHTPVPWAQGARHSEAAATRWHRSLPLLETVLLPTFGQNTTRQTHLARGQHWAIAGLPFVNGSRPRQ